MLSAPLPCILVRSGSSWPAGLRPVSCPLLTPALLQSPAAFLRSTPRGNERPVPATRAFHSFAANSFCVQAAWKRPAGQHLETRLSGSTWRRLPLLASTFFRSLSTPKCSRRTRGSRQSRFTARLLMRSCEVRSTPRWKIKCAPSLLMRQSELVTPWLLAAPEGRCASTPARPQTNVHRLKLRILRFAPDSRVRPRL